MNTTEDPQGPYPVIPVCLCCTSAMSVSGIPDWISTAKSRVLLAH